jgi:hypothetical protein
MGYCTVSSSVIPSSEHPRALREAPWESVTQTPPGVKYNNNKNNNKYGDSLVTINLKMTEPANRLEIL